VNTRAVNCSSCELLDFTQWTGAEIADAWQRDDEDEELELLEL